MSCEFYCKYIKFMVIKVLTATVTNSGRCVYMKSNSDVHAGLRWNANWILMGWYPILCLKQNNQMIKLEKYYAHAS